jgi:archaellum component FlaC
MRQKQLVTQKLERLDNELTNLLSILSYSKDIREVKEKIFTIKENIGDIQTLINNEGNDWN